MGNASIHKTNTTRSIIEQAGCKLLFLPPYSPDLNSLEHLWAITERKIKKYFTRCFFYSRCFVYLIFIRE
ncbi:MAG: transposase [Alphaproteobacteria bacterium]|nr:transposase [Alphaproteobacteria bacterium]